jgi:hypothetical protein
MFTGYDATDCPWDGMGSTIPWDIDCVGSNVTSFIVKDEYISILGQPIVPEYAFDSTIVEIYKQLTSLSRIYIRTDYYCTIAVGEAPHSGFPGADPLGLEDVGSLEKQLGVLQNVLPTVKITMNLLKEKSQHVFTTWQW